MSSLRRSIAVVFQDAGLFNRSIGENIEIGRPGASHEQIEEAAKLAEAHEFAMRKPGGYDFVIGERGASLSGGERQRLALARGDFDGCAASYPGEAHALDSAAEADKLAQCVDWIGCGLGGRRSDRAWLRPGGGILLGIERGGCGAGVV